MTAYSLTVALSSCTGCRVVDGTIRSAYVSVRVRDPSFKIQPEARRRRSRSGSSRQPAANRRSRYPGHAGSAGSEAHRVAPVPRPDEGVNEYAMHHSSGSHGPCKDAPDLIPPPRLDQVRIGKVSVNRRGFVSPISRQPANRRQLLARHDLMARGGGMAQVGHRRHRVLRSLTGSFRPAMSCSTAASISTAEALPGTQRSSA